jgi:hypothetical protein
MEVGAQCIAVVKWTTKGPYSNFKAMVEPILGDHGEIIGDSKNKIMSSSPT